MNLIRFLFGYNSSVPEIYYSFNIGAEWKGIGVNF